MNQRRATTTPPVSKFQRLARTHAFMAIGDAAMYGALAGSFLLGLTPDAQRPKVLLYLLISAAPFAVVAPAIGPTIDRIPGGRRMVMQITAAVRALVYLLMIFHVDDVLLYPLVFVALVMQKTYSVSKSALVPLVVRSDEELVEANSKLGLISGAVGAIAIGPLTLLGKASTTVPLLIGIVLFVCAGLISRRLPRDVVAAVRAERAEKVELRSHGIRAASIAMMLIRACIGFLTFHLLFWLREDYGLAAFGLAAGAAVVGSMIGNVLAPMLRRSLREQRMLVGALAIITVAGVLAAFTAGLGSAVVLAFVVNFSSSIGRMAFDSIVQSDAPDANQGRAFAQFETRFQLSWVLAALPPVAFTLPGWVGFLVVGIIAAAALVLYLKGSAPRARGGRSTAPERRSRPGWAAPPASGRVE